jgi:hypothetical protein
MMPVAEGSANVEENGRVADGGASPVAAGELAREGVIWGDEHWDGKEG